MVGGIILIVGLIALIIIVLLLIADKSPVGYEDENGFHYKEINK